MSGLMDTRGSLRRLLPLGSAGTGTTGTAGGTGRPVTRLAVSVVVIAVGFFVPSFTSSGNTMTILVNGALLGLMALSVGFLLDLLGWVSFGAAAFSGGAAYLFTILCVSLKMSLTEAAILAVVGSVVGGLLVGLIFIRSKALVFTMLTLALGQLLYQVVILDKFSSATGGTNGLVVSFHGTLFGLSSTQLAAPSQVWPLIWTIVVIMVAACYLIGRSRFGRVLRGIRENETRMRHSGYNTYLPKLAAFGFAGLIGSVAGVLSAMNVGFISPDLLTFESSGLAIIAALIGGYQTAIGPIIGGLVVDWGQNEFGSTGNLYLYTGIAIIVVLVLFPRGLSGLAADLWRYAVRYARGSRAPAGEDKPPPGRRRLAAGRATRHAAGEAGERASDNAGERSAHAVD